MRGELLAVWPETWREIWTPLLQNPEYSDDLLMDFYRALVPLPAPPVEPDPDTLEYDDNGEATQESRQVLWQYEAERGEYERLRAEHEEFSTGTRDLRSEIRDFIRSEVTNERTACAILTAVFSIIEAIGDPAYLQRYFELIDKFFKKYSLRYEIRAPFQICPTLPGIFSTLVKELKRISLADDHLSEMMEEFEDSIRDLNIGSTPARIKTVIQKQINLVEAIGCQHPNARSNTISRISEEIGTWPHDRLKDSLKKLYGYTCDYPGIRHGGTRANRIRDIELVDLVAASVLIIGFTPYLTDQIDPVHVFTGH